MKKFAYLLLMLPLLAACSGNDDAKEKAKQDSINGVIQGKDKTISMKDTTIMGYIRMINDIQENLDSIKEKEKIIDAAKSEGNVQNQEEKIKSDLQAIYNKMSENKQKLAAMRSTLKSSNNKMADLQKMIDRLQEDVNAKDSEIVTLKEQLEQLNVQLSTLTTSYDTQTKQLNATTNKLNSAWYAYGTRKELEKQGVITKEGGFIGIGKADKLKADFNKSYFTQIDVTTTKEIQLGTGKSARLVTSHPTGSYTLSGTKLTINDADSFWSASKYLVVVVD